MSQHYSEQHAHPLNANVVALILIITFVVSAGLILANTPFGTPQVDGRDSVAVAFTATPLLSDTPLSPTPTLLPTQTSVPTVTPTKAPVPAITSTPQTVADAGSTSQGHTAADYDPALAARGEPLFAQCAACHGADGRGLPNLGKNLVDSEFLHSLTDEELLAFIKTGRPMWDPLNTSGIDMPPKGGNPALSDEDIMAIIAYIHSLVPA
jgi:mono/diheme cytochrome c family protein